MAAAIESAAPRQALRQPAPAWSRILTAWHLLSLDAPTVAALWCWLLARAMRLQLPWHAPLLLALGTWLIYVADRILDGYTAAHLRRRHRFHARHRAAFLGAGVVTGAILLWLIATRMIANAREEDAALFSIALLYLFAVHRPGSKAGGWLPKELAVGIVFAAATAVPAWSRLQAGRASLFPAVAIFAALCWLNCVAIERWENPPDAIDPAASHPTTRWTAERFRPVAFSLAALAAILAAGTLRQTRTDIFAVYLSALAAALCFAMIDLHRARFTPTGLRIAADLALLTPLLLLPFLRR